MNRIELSTIGGNVSLGGGGRAPKPEDCMKDCIAWYSPKRQGITNEYLQDHYLDDDAVLQDLSGNGNDIALHNMEGEEGGGCVNDDGDLVFDGVDDFGLLDKITLGNCAMAFNCDLAFGESDVNINRAVIDLTNPSSLGTHYIIFRTYALRNYFDIFRVNSYTWCGRDANQVDNLRTCIINFADKEHAHILYPSNIIFQLMGNAGDASIARAGLWQSDAIVDKALYIGKEKQHEHYTDCIFRELLFFRRNLTHEEAKWVYDNILTTDTNNQNS